MGYEILGTNGLFFKDFQTLVAPCLEYIEQIKNKKSPQFQTVSYFFLSIPKFK